MKFITTLLALLFCSSFTSNAEIYPGMKVIGGYKALDVSFAPVNRNQFGLTQEDVERTVKLRLLTNGIKTVGRTKLHYLYIDVNTLESQNDTIFDIDLKLKKYSDAYGVSRNAAGFVFIPNQSSYGSVGIINTSKSFILESLLNALDKFLLDYLESNME